MLNQIITGDKDAGKRTIQSDKDILTKRTETAEIEFKSAREGVPEKLYDSFSSFSNTRGGIIIFGIDEKAGYKVCGVKNPDELQKKIVNQQPTGQDPGYERQSISYPC